MAHCILADRKEENKWARYQQVWGEIEKSLPILIETNETKLSLDEPEIWFVRVMYSKLEGKCIDIRQFEKQEDENTIRYVPTENGITVSISNWIKLIDPLFKYLRKHK